jgi:hypothetical protein
MKRFAFFILVLFAQAVTASAQALTVAPDASGMMADDTSYNALQASGKLAAKSADLKTKYGITEDGILKNLAKPM